MKTPSSRTLLILGVGLLCLTLWGLTGFQLFPSEIHRPTSKLNSNPAHRPKISELGRGDIKLNITTHFDSKPRPPAVDLSMHPLFTKVKSVIEPYCDQIKNLEASSAKVVGHYQDGGNEVAAVEFSSLNLEEFKDILESVSTAIGQEFDSKQVEEAQALASKYLSEFVTPEYPRKGLMVVCPNEGDATPKFGLSQNQETSPFIEESGKLFPTANNGRVGFVSMAEAQTRFSHLIKLVDEP